MSIEMENSYLDESTFLITLTDSERYWMIMFDELGWIYEHIDYNVFLIHMHNKKICVIAPQCDDHGIHYVVLTKTYLERYGYLITLHRDAKMLTSVGIDVPIIGKLYNSENLTNNTPIHVVLYACHGHWLMGSLNMHSGERLCSVPSNCLQYLHDRGIKEVEVEACYQQYMDIHRRLMYARGYISEDQDNDDAWRICIMTTK